jgi:hypothetical protein
MNPFGGVQGQSHATGRNLSFSGINANQGAVQICGDSFRKIPNGWDRHARAEFQ